MTDHYTILGLTKSATPTEIKAAYRRLVKLYHPDKNPNNYDAVEKFRKIQEAYEVVGNFISRTKYDNKITYSEYFTQQTKPQAQQARTKKYSFTDEDLKSRQFYKNQYKQQSKASVKTNSKEEKKRYNETRSILLAIPLAIALLFFIINVYERSGKGIKQENKKEEPDKSIAVAEEKISVSDQPYNYYFGNPKIDKNSSQVLQVTNYSGLDAIVCVADSKTNKIIRHYFIENSFVLYFEYLPEGNYYLKNYLGTNFNLKKKIDSLNVTGTFENESQFQSFSNKSFEINITRKDTIFEEVNLINKDKTKNLITKADFFFN